MKTERLHSLVDLITAANYQFIFNRMLSTQADIALTKYHVLIHVTEDVDGKIKGVTYSSTDLGGCVYDPGLIKAENHIRQLMEGR